MISHLEQLRKAHPGFNWPDPPEPRNYPQELGGTLGNIKSFGFPPHRYRLSFRTSSEESAIKYQTGKKTIITFNPIRLETYGVWVRL